MLPACCDAMRAYAAMLPPFSHTLFAATPPPSCVSIFATATPPASARAARYRATFSTPLLAAFRH